MANWTAAPGSVWTLPLGLGVSKVVKFGKLPVKVGIAGQYMPIHPGRLRAAVEHPTVLNPCDPEAYKGGRLLRVTPSCPGWASYSRKEGLAMKRLFVFVIMVFAFRGFLVQP